MTLLAAVHLPRKLYIAGDTRVTFKDPRTGKIIKTQDDLIKASGLAPNIRMYVAGSTRLAAHFSFELRTLVNSKTTINQFRQIVEKNVGKIIDSYLSRGGNTDEGVAIIFGGHNKSSGKFVNSSWAKEILDRHVPKIEGQTFHAPIDSAVLNAIAEHAKYHGQVKDGTQVWAKNLPSSRVFALKIGRIDGSTDPEFIDLACPGTLVISPDSTAVKEEMPRELLYRIDSTIHGDPKADMEKDLGLVQSFIIAAAKDHRLTTVGGCVFAMRVVPGGDYYLMGELRRRNLKTGKDELLFKIYQKDGEIAYSVGDEEGYLRSYESFLNEQEIKPSARMEI